ncbi:MAG: 2-amino-4-hydroxy-6-hydroxymethyldihydropteridine diphosphokinase, partial [Paenibacillus sp. RIFOXYA1_FULL_44_5]
LVALGSNMGNREAYLYKAMDALEQHAFISISQKSDIYETDPVGFVDQAMFLNMVIEISSSLPPDALLQELQRIERDLDRVRDIHWGPRTIDLDLLWYDDRHIHTEQLVVTHPRMMERAFVLLPLADIWNKDRHIAGKSLHEHLKKLQGKEGVRKWKKVHYPIESELSEN